MKSAIKIFTFAIAMFFTFFHVKAAEQPLYKSHKEELKAIEAYLNNITTLKSAVVQLDSSNHKSEGILLVKRPNKLSLDFYSGHLNAKMIANGRVITIYDRTLDETSYANAHKTTANILLRQKIEFNKTRITSVDNENGMIIVAFYLSSDEKENLFKIHFIPGSSPKLHKIEVIDRNNNGSGSVSLTFLTHQINGVIDDKAFILKDKRIFNGES